LPILIVCDFPRILAALIALRLYYRASPYPAPPAVRQSAPWRHGGPPRHR
jgi:hypothetical protein